jgi:branched-subunit amino acid transport protein
MVNQLAVVAAMLALAAGTFAVRLAGPVLRTRISFPARAERLLEAAAIVLLAALVATTALTTAHTLAGVGRPAGVAVAGLLAWRRAPFIVVILAAAATAALIRLLPI